jgi:hypothetical protein
VLGPALALAEAETDEAALPEALPHLVREVALPVTRPTDESAVIVKWAVARIDGAGAGQRELLLVVEALHERPAKPCRTESKSAYGTASCPHTHVGALSPRSVPWTNGRVVVSGRPQSWHGAVNGSTP